MLNQTIEIIVHRTQSWGSDLLGALEKLYKDGFRSFEIDVFFSGEFCVGRRPRDCAAEVEETVVWMKWHPDVLMYWDMKYPFQWDVSKEEAKNILIDIASDMRQRIFLISYDYMYLQEFKDVMQCGKICNKFCDCHDADLLVIPYSQVRVHLTNIHALIRRGKQIIVTQVTTQTQVLWLTEQGVMKVMTDYPYRLL